MIAVQRLIDFVRALRPPRRWHVWVLLLAGVFAGLVAVTLHVSRATSYLGDDPATCVNCHIMAPQYATWAASSHAQHATCNDCHVPHQNAVMKYGFKAYDGTRHAFMYTFRLEPQVIRIHAPGAAVVRDNCIRCHQSLFAGVGAATGRPADSAAERHGGDRACWDCHRETPHGRVNSLASVPLTANTPGPAPLTVPAWLNRHLDKATPAAPAKP